MQPDFWVIQVPVHWVRDGGGGGGVSVGLRLPGLQANQSHRCSFEGKN
jgi:hypothetical protein